MAEAFGSRWRNPCLPTGARRDASTRTVHELLRVRLRELIALQLPLQGLLNGDVGRLQGIGSRGAS
jgi:hypothetical protein